MYGWRVWERVLMLLLCEGLCFYSCFASSVGVGCLAWLTKTFSIVVFFCAGYSRHSRREQEYGFFWDGGDRLSFPDSIWRLMGFVAGRLATKFCIRV
jgi:hypothetical protein